MRTIGARAKFNLYEQQEKRLMDERVSLKGALEDGEKKGESKGRKEGLKEGLEKGLKKGLEKGREAEKINIAQAALEKGLDVKTVAALTGLSVQAIKRLTPGQALL